MKKAFIAACLMASVSAFADYQVCKTYEFAELNTLSDPDLEKLLKKYEYNLEFTKKREVNNARDLRENFNDQQNCEEEVARVQRLIDSRKKVITGKKSK